METALSFNSDITTKNLDESLFSDDDDERNAILDSSRTNLNPRMDS
jgi:hypothetical protein